MLGQQILDVHGIQARLASLRQKRKETLNGRPYDFDSMTPEQRTAISGLDSQIGFCTEQLREHEAGAHFQHKPTPGALNLGALAGVINGEQEGAGKSAMEAISTFLRTGKILQTDTPLHYIESPVSGGLAAAIPTEVLNSLAAYFRNDAFALAGATIYQTDNTTPLVKPLVSAGSDFDTFNEGQSATDSHPMEVDSFTFGGTKYSRLVKVSEESLMNSALDLPSEIVNELAASLVNSFTNAITDALQTAVLGNGALHIDRTHYTDIYGAILAQILAVPPRWDAPTNAFMCSRADLQVIKNTRSTTNEPLFDSASGTILNKRVVINDRCTRVFYGNWAAGAFVRKSPLTLLRLIELYSSTGHVGFKMTQYLDSKFLASVSAIEAQPLISLNVDMAGS